MAAGRDAAERLHRQGPTGVTVLRPELLGIVKGLLAREGAEISLDELGDAIGVLSISTGEIDAMIAALEAAGRSVGAKAKEARGEKLLAEVLASARVLRDELGRSASPEEIAARSGLTPEEVRHALALARVMQR